MQASLTFFGRYFIAKRSLFRRAQELTRAIAYQNMGVSIVNLDVFGRKRLERNGPLPTRLKETQKNSKSFSSELKYLSIIKNG
jgi:hypothetical protein